MLAIDQNGREGLSLSRFFLWTEIYPDSASLKSLIYSHIRGRVGRLHDLSNKVWGREHRQSRKRSFDYEKE
jgi:hypothetical protein